MGNAKPQLKRANNVKEMQKPALIIVGNTGVKMLKIIFLALIILVSPFMVSCTDLPTEPNRCAAITQEGTQCKRNAEKGSIYCWQHKK